MNRVLESPYVSRTEARLPSRPACCRPEADCSASSKRQCCQCNLNSEGYLLLLARTELPKSLSRRHGARRCNVRRVVFDSISGGHSRGLAARGRGALAENWFPCGNKAISLNKNLHLQQLSTGMAREFQRCVETVSGAATRFAGSRN